MAELIAKRYAAALFDIALEKDSVDKFYTDALDVYDTINSSEEFLSVLKHPRISGEEKMNVLTSAFAGKIENDILGLFAVAVKKNREAQILDITQAFIDRIKEHKGIATASVVSAKPLSEEQLSRIKQRLESGLQKQVEIESSTDDSLIGGVKISVCGQLIDNTVKRHLAELRKTLG